MTKPEHNKTNIYMLGHRKKTLKPFQKQQARLNYVLNKTHRLAHIRLQKVLETQKQGFILWPGTENFGQSD